MPVYEIQDPQGRTLEIDGDHEPTAEELTNIFTQAFPALAQPPPERPALVRAPLPTMGAQGQQMLQTGMEQLSKPLINIPEKAPDFGTHLPEEVPEGILKKTGQAIGGEALQLLSGITSPIGLASIPGMMVAPEVVGPLMAMSMAPVVGEGVKQTISAKDIPEAARGITKTVFGGAGVAGGLLAPLHARLLPKAAEETAKATGEKVPVAPKEIEVSDAIPKRETEEVPVAIPPGDRPEVGAQVREQAPTQAQKEAEVTKPAPIEETWEPSGEIRRTEGGMFEWVENGKVLDTDRDPTELIGRWHSDNAGYSTRVRQISPDRYELDLAEPKDPENPTHELLPLGKQSKPPPLSTAERAEVQAELSQAMGEEPVYPPWASPKLASAIKRAQLQKPGDFQPFPEWKDASPEQQRLLLASDFDFKKENGQILIAPRFSKSKRISKIRFAEQAAPAPKVEETKPAETTPQNERIRTNRAELQTPEAFTAQEIQELAISKLGNMDERSQGNITFDISSWTSSAKKEAQSIPSTFTYSPEGTDRILIEFPAGTRPKDALESLVEAIKQGDGPGDSWLPIKQYEEIKQAIKRGDPILAETANAHGIKLPRGYAEEGGVYRRVVNKKTGTKSNTPSSGTTRIEPPVEFPPVEKGPQAEVFESEVKGATTEALEEKVTQLKFHLDQLKYGVRAAGVTKDMEARWRTDWERQLKFINNELSRRSGPISPGPGAAASGEPGTYSAIEQLSDRLRTVPSEAKADPLNWRERMADTMTAGKSAFAKVVGRVRAISETMKEGIRGIWDINDTERAVGVLDRELQTSSGESANLGKVMKRTYKDANMRRAAALYIDAGGDIKQFQDALARGLPKGTRPEVRRAIETVANMSDEGKQLADFLREYYGIREGEAVASDIFKEGLDDYYTHIWKKEANMPDKLRAAITTGKVNTYWQFARQRKISTFLEGIMEGKTPVLDPAEVVPYYNFTLDRAIASRAFVKQLSTIDASDGRPAVAATGTRQEIAGNKDMVLIRPQAKNSTYADYRSVDHPAMHRWKWAETTPDGKTVLYQGELQVHPEFYERLARFMERSRLTPGKTARATLRLGSEMKAAKFGLASMFHQIHVGAHAAFHWANPFKVSNRPWVSEDGLINFRHPFVQEAIEKGHLKIAPEPWELNVMSEGILNHGSLIHKVPFIGPWSRVYSEWLFTNYIPKLKLATYEAALPRNRRWFAGKLTDEQIQARVGDAVNNAYGELNRLFLGKYGRDPRFQRALQMAFLAPDFGEARLRFVSKALTKAGAEERLALATMFTTLYTTARIGNYLSHGNPEWDWKKAFSVKVGDHWFSIRSVIGDVDHALADFVQFATVRLSPLSRTLLEGLSKRDARGQKRLPSEQVGDFMRQFIPISLQGVAEPERAMWESFSSAMGLSARRENSEQEVRLMVRDWMKKSKDPAVQNKLARIEKETFAPSEYGPLRSKLRLHDMQGAQEEYRKLRRVKTPQMIDTAMRPTRPLAGSYKMELEFRRSLKPSERSIYNRAKRDREQQYERFLQLPR